MLYYNYYFTEIKTDGLQSRNRGEEVLVLGLELCILVYYNNSECVVLIETNDG